MNKALLDTDIYSEVLKGVNSKVLQKARTYQTAFGHFTISAISVMEIVSGHQRVNATAQMQRFRAAVMLDEILNFDYAAAELAGTISGNLDRLGQPIGVADPMIAAIALRHGLELVTGNTAHYARIQGLGHALVLHDWRA
jgi:predicted nucleic acid-binding protein